MIRFGLTKNVFLKFYFLFVIVGAFRVKRRFTTIVLQIIMVANDFGTIPNFYNLLLLSHFATLSSSSFPNGHTRISHVRFGYLPRISRNDLSYTYRDFATRAVRSCVSTDRARIISFLEDGQHQLSIIVSRACGVSIIEN